MSCRSEHLLKTFNDDDRLNEHYKSQESDLSPGKASASKLQAFYGLTEENILNFCKLDRISFRSKKSNSNTHKRVSFTSSIGKNLRTSTKEMVYNALTWPMRKRKHPIDLRLIPSKPVLRLDDSTRQYLQKRVEEDVLRQAAIGSMINELKKGAVLTKFNGFKTSNRCFFYVNDVESELRWFQSTSGDFDPLAPVYKIQLGDIVEIKFGPFLPGFTYYDWEDRHPYNCFSIVIYGTKHQLNLECSNRVEFFQWFLGLQHLAPLSHRHISRGRLLWARAIFKLLLRSNLSGSKMNRTILANPNFYKTSL